MAEYNSLFLFVTSGCFSFLYIVFEGHVTNPELARVDGQRKARCTRSLRRPQQNERNNYLVGQSDASTYVYVAFCNLGSSEDTARCPAHPT